MLSTLHRIRSQVAWANRRIDDFERGAADFYATKPYVIGSKEYPERGQRVYHLASLADIPDDLAKITADALHNLRIPLDHIAFQTESAACVNASHRQRVYFPIAQSAANYPAVRDASIKCAGKSFIDALDAAEPYQAGRGHVLWQLHELDKPNKHKESLALTGGYHAFDFAPIARDVMRKDKPDWLDLSLIPSVFLRPADRMCPLEVGDELFAEPLDTEVYEERQFLLEISFYEPGVIECEPVLKTLKDMADVVSGIVTAFGPLLP